MIERILKEWISILFFKNYNMIGEKRHEQNSGNVSKLSLQYVSDFKHKLNFCLKLNILYGNTGALLKHATPSFTKQAKMVRVQLMKRHLIQKAIKL